MQYAATGYIQRLEAAHVQISMAAVGRPTENAYVERLMRTLKEEEVYLHEYRDLEDTRQHIGRFLDEVYMRHPRAFGPWLCPSSRVRGPMACGAPQCFQVRDGEM